MPKKEEDFIKQMIKKYGEGVLVGEQNTPEGISTGSVSLDASIGVGGIPRSKFTEIFGPEGSGKTTIALATAKNAGLMGYKTLYIDVENMLDYEYADTIVGGIDRTKLIIVQPNSSEDAFNIAIDGCNSGEFQFIVFDSIGALSPQKEMDEDFTDANVAIIPRQLTKFLRVSKNAVLTNGIAFLFINQVRDNVGSYSQGYATPGGHALKHLATVIIQLGKGAPIKAGDKQIGMNVTFTTKKNKLAPPFRSYTMPLIYGKGVDSLRDLLTFGEACGIIQVAGPYKRYGEIAIGRGMVESIKNLEADPKLLKEIREKILQSVKSFGKEVDEPLTSLE